MWGAAHDVGSDCDGHKSKWGEIALFREMFAASK
jgi:hypothetical protein